MTSLLSLGIAGALGPDAIARLAPTVEAAGFHALWVNDTPGADSLAALAAAARTTTTLTLATGVVPVDRRSTSEIAAQARDVPQGRLVLGIGSGQSRTGALARVRAAIAELREHTSARILVGALGPKMRALAARDAGGPLLSWLTPAVAAAQADEARAQGTHPHVALYVRTALDEAALGRLEKEAAQYAGYPNYAANFARLGFTAADTVLIPEAFATGIQSYRDAVDEVVLRAIVPGDDLADYERFVEQAAAVL
ncbi:MAG: LLM class flavin-dependent oxidoreductase [Microbacterium sp.]|uniref:LLM class flavin-dependent oxidoreductase n=1 Tax=Microbacterium sp. TaxID=51671 RepID=UPI003A8826A2